MSPCIQANDIQLHFIDHPGLSDRADHGYGRANHAAEIVGLLGHLDRQEVILGRHLFGGRLTLRIVRDLLKKGQEITSGIQLWQESIDARCK